MSWTDRLSDTQKALLLLGSAFLAGFGAYAAVQSYVGLPARVKALEVLTGNQGKQLIELQNSNFVPNNELDDLLGSKGFIKQGQRIMIMDANDPTVVLYRHATNFANTYSISRTGNTERWSRVWVLQGTSE